MQGKFLKNDVLPVEFCRDVQSEASFKNLKMRRKRKLRNNI